MQSSITMSKKVVKSSLKEKQPPIIKYSLGIDVGKDSLDVCLSVIDTSQRIRVLGSRKFANTLVEHKKLHTWLEGKHKEDKPLVCLMEATGVYYENIAIFLDKYYQVSIVLPNRAKQYLRGMGLKSKNDRIDAQGLSRMGAEQVLEVWKRPCDEAIRLRQITRTCESSQEIKTVLNNQLEALTNSGFQEKEIIRSIKQEIALLDKHIARYKELAEKIVSSIPEIEEKVKNITEISGVGLYTVAVILAETGFFELFHSQRQLTSYAGYDVVENQSGKRQGKTKISKKGNAHIRRALHMPAFNVVRWEGGVFAALWERVYFRTNKKMIAYVAVQRKLLLIIYTLWMKNEKFKHIQKSATNKEGASGNMLS